MPMPNQTGSRVPNGPCLIKYALQFAIIVFTASHISNAEAFPTCEELFFTRESVFTGLKTPTFMKDVISHPFPDQKTKVARVMAALPIFENAIHNSSGRGGSLSTREYWERDITKLVDYVKIRNEGLKFEIESAEGSVDGKRLPLEKTHVPTIPPDGQPGLPIRLTIIGNAVVMSFWGDLGNSGTIVLFDGTRIIRNMPVTEFILAGIPEKTVRIQRNASFAEGELWKRKDLVGLLDGGKSQGYQSNSLHFHLGEFKRYGFNPGNSTIVVDLPKDQLIDLNKKGWIRTGFTFTGGPDWMVFEIVILEPGWEVLVNHTRSVTPVPDEIVPGSGSSDPG